MDKKTLQQLQETDETLKVIRDGVDQSSKPFFREGGLLYRKWERRHKGEPEPLSQLVLPKECQQKALKLAHFIPRPHRKEEDLRTP